MNLKKRVILSVGIPIILGIFAQFFAIIPCKIGLSIPNPTTSWSKCQLNLFNLLPKSYFSSYLGLTANPLFFGICAFLVLFVILFWITKYLPSFNKK